MSELSWKEDGYGIPIKKGTPLQPRIKKGIPLQPRIKKGIPGFPPLVFLIWGVGVSPN